MDKQRRQEMNAKKGLLTVEEVLRIRELLKEGVWTRELARIYGVSQQTIVRIRDKTSWGWLKETGLTEDFVEAQLQKPLSSDEEAAARESQEKLLRLLQGDGK